MSIFRFRIPKIFCSSGHKNLQGPVCKSVSHFNWFARYDVGNVSKEMARRVDITPIAEIEVSV